MAITAQEFIAARAPQFSSDPRLSSFITIATQRTSTTAYGDNYGMAIGLRVCHMMDLEAQRGGSSSNSKASVPGALTSITEGELSKSYSGAMQKRYGDKYPDLCQTAYGIELVELIESSILCPRTRIPDSNFS